MGKRARIIAMTLGLALVGGVATLVHFGCSALPPPISGTLRPSEYRSRQLTALAAEEATQIPDADVRLTRQLNLADLQMSRGWTDDARVTLAATATTLASAEAGQLKNHARISGWVSVSELSRRLKDTAAATAACESAALHMRKLDDPARRCDYVMGIANEMQYLKGKAAAVGLITEAGPWTRAIEDLAQRRQATVAFASALFNFDDFAAGQKMLRQDDDPAWRSQTLMALAAPAPAAAQFTAAAPRDERAVSPTTYYGKRVDYKNVFQNQTRSQTSD